MAPHRRAVAMASAAIRAAPCPLAAAPRRSRVAAITGAARSVQMVASWALMPRTLVYPNCAPCLEGP